MSRDEALAEAQPLARIPSTPFAFIWFLVRTHYALRISVLVGLAALGAAIDAFGPLALSHLINAITAAVKSHASFADAVLPWVALFGLIWISAAFIYRGYEWIDVDTSPRMRALAQKYLFAYLLGHSPRYFQENFAGKLGQKIKQAGQATVAILNILCLDMVRVAGLVIVGGILMFRANAVYAVILMAWTVLYLGIVVSLARRCVAAVEEFLRRGFHLHRAADRRHHQCRSRARLRQGRLRAALSLVLPDRRDERLAPPAPLPHRHAHLHAVRDAGAADRIAAGRQPWMRFPARSASAHSRWSISSAHPSRAACRNCRSACSIISNSSARSPKPSNSSASITRSSMRPMQSRSSSAKARSASENIRFAHPDGQIVFADLSLDIKAGEKVGLVGPSGAGKSTLVKMLRRQYEPQSGRILIDGQDISHVTWDSLNEGIAEVQQTPGVFHRAVRDNIRYARPGAREEEVVRAAADAHAHDFISARSTGYGTIVGEQGIKLSGGERQRVAIARALVKDAKILVLDEATSSLDSESEHLIQEGLWTLMQGRTVIAIAHRLSTIASMDRIVYLEAGRIIEDGPHRELAGPAAGPMRSCGIARWAASSTRREAATFRFSP